MQGKFPQKRGFLVVLFAVFASASGQVFSQERTDWFSFGFELGNYLENYKASGDLYKAQGLEGAKIETSMMAPGIGLGGYSFYGENTAGFFSHGSNSHFWQKPHDNNRK